MQICARCKIRFNGSTELCPECVRRGASPPSGAPIPPRATPTPTAKIASPPRRRGTQGSWWRHYLTFENTEPAILQQGRNVIFGRQDDCDYKISSKKASRRHAEIMWKGNQAIVVDLGSNNGTFVNDQKVGEHPLKNGDEIRIASFICTYRKVHSEEELEDEEGRDAATLAGGAAMRSGRLEQTPVVEVVTGLARERASGVLSFFPKKGKIGIKGGDPFWAEAGTERGEAAITSLLLLTQGMFVFTPQYEERPRDCTRGFAQIMAEAIERGVQGLEAPAEPAPPPGSGVMPPPVIRPPTRRGSRRVSTESVRAPAPMPPPAPAPRPPSGRPQRRPGPPPPPPPPPQQG